MPKCLNNPSKRYTGNENTPKGKGYIASAEKIGKKMRGTDGNMYVVSSKGGNKRWVKASIQTKTSQMSPMTKRKQKKRKNHLLRRDLLSQMNLHWRNLGRIPPTRRRLNGN